MAELTVYELMGEQHQLEAFLNAQTRDVLIGITNQDDELVYSERSHMFAWEELVSFAKQVLACDVRIQQHLTLLEEEKK